MPVSKISVSTSSSYGWLAVLLRLFLLLLIITCFFITINLMGASLKGLSRGTLQEFMDSAVANPLSALFIGIAITALVQSSSVTTSIVVGMVAGGVIDVTQAVPMIMGANIGTTVTNLLVSLVHIRNRLEFRRAFSSAIVHDFFNILSVLVLLPLELKFHLIRKTAFWLKDHVVGESMGKVPGIKTLIKPIVEELHQLFGGGYLCLTVSVLMLVISLILMVKTIRSLVLSRMTRLLDRFLFRTTAHALFLGLFITVVVQSSSVTTSLIVPLAGAGLLTVNQVYPYTLGSNVGTTITSFLAASAIASTSPGDPKAQLGVVVALMHLNFNVFGIAIFLPLKRIPIGLATGFASYITVSRRRTVLALTGLSAVFIALLIFTFI